MGRFYKQTQPENVDFMYKLPEALMIQATQQAAQDIEQNQAAMYSLYDKLNLSALSSDKERAKQLVGEYEGKIGEMAQQLQKDPLSFRRKTGDIIGLSRQIQQDWTKGEAAAIQSNYNQLAEWEKRMEDMVKSGKIDDPQAINYMRQYMMNKFKGTQYDKGSGKYNQLYTEDLSPFVNVREEFDKYVKDMKPHVLATSNIEDVGNGQYIRKTDKTVERLGEDEVLSMLWNSFAADDKVKNYIHQRSKIGMLEGYYEKDADGNMTNNFVKPYSYDEKTGKFNYDTNSPLGSIMKGMVDKYARTNIIKKDISQTANPYSLAAFRETIKNENDSDPSSKKTKENNNPVPDNNAQKVVSNVMLRSSADYINLRTESLNLAAQYKDPKQLGLDLNSTELAQYQGLLKTALNGGDGSAFVDFVSSKSGEGNNAGMVAQNLVNNFGTSILYIKQFDYMKKNAVYADDYFDFASDINNRRKDSGQKPFDIDSDELNTRYVNDRILNNPAFNQAVKPVQVTYGNRFDASIKKEAKKYVASFDGFVKNPTNWGNFFYVEYDEKGNPKQTVETNLSSLIAEGKITQSSVKGITFNSNDEETEASVSSGKVNNVVGKAGLVSQTLDFYYSPIGTKGNKDKHEREAFMIQVPIATSDPKHPNAVIYIPSSRIQDPDFDGFKNYSEIMLQEEEMSEFRSDLQAAYNNFIMVKGINKNFNDESYKETLKGYGVKTE